MPSSSSAKGSPRRERRESAGLEAAAQSVSVVDDPNLERKPVKSSKRKKGKTKEGNRSNEDPAGFFSRDAEERTYDDNERNPLSLTIASGENPESEKEESELLDDT
jgi:hypothetical protein